MLFTRAERYALRCAIYLAEKPPGTVTSLAELARHEGVSKQFLANLLTHLTAAGLLHSHHGLHGGYTLNRPAGRMTVADIWDALRGGDAPINCFVDGVECPQKSVCPIRKLFERSFARLHANLATCTVRRVAKELAKLPMPPSCASTHPKRSSAVG